MKTGTSFSMVRSLALLNLLMDYLDIIPPTVPVQEALARRQQAAKQAEENCM